MEEEDKVDTAIGKHQASQIFFSSSAFDLKAPFPTAATTAEKNGAGPFPDFSPTCWSSF